MKLINYHHWSPQRPGAFRMNGMKSASGKGLRALRHADTHGLRNAGACAKWHVPGNSSPFG